MSELREIHEQIEKIQNVIIKKRLEHLDTLKGTDFVWDMSDDRMIDHNDFGVLFGIVNQEGLCDGSGYIQYRQDFDYDEFANNVIMKINGQLYEFSLDCCNEFDARVLTSTTSRNADGLVDINLDKLLKIDSQKTLQDTPISKLVEKLKAKRKEFMTLKLSRAIKDIQDGKEPSSDTELAIYHEADILFRDMLLKKNFRDNVDYISKHHIIKHELFTDRNPVTYYIRVEDNIIKYDEASGKVSKETSIQDLEELFKDEDIDSIIEKERANVSALELENKPENYILIHRAKELKLIRGFKDKPDNIQLLALKPIDLEKLGISLETIENQREGNAQLREVPISEVGEVAKGVTLTTAQNTLGVVTNSNEEKVINNDGNLIMMNK